MAWESLKEPTEHSFSKTVRNAREYAGNDGDPEVKHTVTFLVHTRDCDEQERNYRENGNDQDSSCMSYIYAAVAIDNSGGCTKENHEEKKVAHQMLLTKGLS